MGYDLVPGEANGSFALQIGEPLIELGLLWIVHGESVPVTSERFPELIEQVELLLAAEPADVHRGAHASKMARDRIPEKTWPRR